MRIPDQKVDEIYESADIVEVISDFVSLKRKGHNYWGLSPFQKEKTPSFSVSPGKKIFKCFSSGIGGNVVKFLMEAEGMTYPEALKYIANKYKIDLSVSETEEDKQKEEARRAEKERIKKGVQYYIDQRGEEFATFIDQRRLSKQIVDQYQLGFAPDQDAWAKIPRVIFTIWNAFGDPIGFGGRKLDGDGPKYINSSSSPIYNKSQILYAWHIARSEVLRKDLAILVEGYMDTLAMHQREIKNVTATCGTALTKHHARIIKRATNNVLILRDADKAGLNATQDDIQVLLEEGMNPMVLQLPWGMDPDDYMRDFGALSFTDLQEKKTLTWLGFLTKLLSKEEMSANDRTEMIRAVCANLKFIPDLISQREHIKDAAKLLDTPEDLIYQELGIVPPSAEVSPEELVPVKDFRRTFKEMSALYKQLGLRKNPDFTKSDQGYIRIAYKDIKGKDHKRTKDGVSSPAFRVTNSTNKPTGVYIPPALRDGGKLHPASKIPGLPESDPDSAVHRESIKSHPLLLVLDEIAADILCELGVPAIGLPRKDGFAAKLGSEQLHSMLASVLNYGFSTVIFMLPGEAFRLPYVKRIPGEYPFAEVDAGKNAEAFSNILIRLNKCLRNFKLKTHIIHPELSEDGPQASHDLWIDEWILNLQAPTLVPHILSALDEVSSFNLIHHETFYYDHGQMMEIMMANSPQKFYEFHGFDSLSGVFKFCKAVYEADPNTGKVTQKEKDGPSADVWFHTRTGFIMAREKKREKCIGEFNITCEVMIKGHKALNLYTITNDTQTVTRQLIMSPSDFRKPDAFCDLIGNLPGMKCFFTGSKQNLLDLQKLVHDNAMEATTLEGHLGHLELEDGDWCYVRGNGLVDSSGNFHEVDERGLIEFKNTTYFLPAESSILKSTTHSYDLEKGFSFHSSEISFKEYIYLFHDVFGGAAHATFSFILASLYYDFIFKTNNCFPHLFLEGVPGSGKTKCAISGLALFGKVDGLNLDSTRVTPPAFGATFAQFHNGINYINEFNLQTIPKWMALALKSPYDGQLGARMERDWTTNRIDYGQVTSATILAGQNPIYLQESINERANIFEIEKRDDYTAEEDAQFDLLTKKVAKQGLGHLLAKLLSYRHLIKQYFVPYQSEIRRWLKENTRCNSGKADRLIENHSMTVAPLLILIEKANLAYPWNRDEILDFTGYQIEKHDREMVSKGLLDLLFHDFIEGYYMDPQYGLNDNHVFLDRDRGVLNIQITSLYPRFKDFLRRNYPELENTSKTEITRKLKTHPAAIKAKGAKAAKSNPKAWVGYLRDETRRIKVRQTGLNSNGSPRMEPEKKWTSAYQFDPVKLNIDLSNVKFSFDNHRDLGAGDIVSENK